MPCRHCPQLALPAAGRAARSCHACLPAQFLCPLGRPAPGCRHGPKLPGVEEFVRTGEGTAEAVIKAAKEQRAAEQARRQRSQEVDALLAAEGMQHLRWRVPGLQLWVETGEGAGGEALVAAARRAEEEQGQRRQAMKELLSAEGLEWHMHSKGVDAWVSRGEGSEAEALAAARQANQTREQSHQRYRRLQDLLAAEGIEYWLVFEEPDVRAWWRCEGGSEEAALAAARAAWEPHRQRKHRRERLMTALKAEGIKYNEVRGGSCPAGAWAYAKPKALAVQLFAWVRAAAGRVFQLLQLHAPDRGDSAAGASWPCRVPCRLLDSRSLMPCICPSRRCASLCLAWRLGCTAGGATRRRCWRPPAASTRRRLTIASAGQRLPRCWRRRA